MAINKTTKAPKEPASVGVAQPAYIALMITEMTTAIGIIPGNVLNFSLREYLLDGGPNLGFFLAQRIIINA